jgi:predicted RNA-binding protein (virulence factor B family)
MNEDELTEQLENLSNEFMAKISEHFKSKGSIVQLESLNFMIASSNRLLEVSGDSVATLRIKKCRKNEQGQIVCP